MPRPENVIAISEKIASGAPHFYHHNEVVRIDNYRRHYVLTHLLMQGPGTVIRYISTEDVADNKLILEYDSVVVDLVQELFPMVHELKGRVLDYCVAGSNLRFLIEEYYTSSLNAKPMSLILKGNTNNFIETMLSLQNFIKKSQLALVASGYPPLGKHYGWTVPVDPIKSYHEMVEGSFNTTLAVCENWLNEIAQLMETVKPTKGS